MNRIYEDTYYDFESVRIEEELRKKPPYISTRNAERILNELLHTEKLLQELIKSVQIIIESKKHD